MRTSAKLNMYRKVVSEIGVRGLFERRRANRHGNSTITTRLSAFPMFVRQGTSDLLVFDQVFIDREYRCIDHLKNVRLIIDAGANVGYSSAYLLTRFPDSRVVALEPDPANFVGLCRNLRPWSDRATLVQAALWSEPAMLDFRAETTATGDEWGRQVEARVGDVRALDMPSLIAQHGPIDLLKIDIEGAEKHVFAADVSWLDSVRNIVIELHSENDRNIFAHAIGGQDYAVSKCEELTVCLSER